MNKYKGFTLIELLMVIAVVSLLSTIVLGNLNSAREKGRIAALQQFASSLHHSIGDELVGEWKFDSDTLVDTSGWGNDGTHSRGVSLPGDFVDGVMGRSMMFDGTSDFVSTNLIVDLTQVVSVSFWIKSNESTPGSPIYLGSYGGGGVTVESRDDYNFEQFRFRYAGSGAGHVISTGIVNDGDWHHIVWYQKGGQQNDNWGLYVNGKLRAETIIPTDRTQSASFTIGDGTHGEYNGTIDDVCVYKKILTSAQIQKLYAEGLADHPALASK